VDISTEWIDLMASDVEPLPKYRKRVEERDALGLCLLCDKPATRRGLCDSHHYQFRMERLGTPKTRRRVYENERIRNGTIMGDRQGQPVSRLRQQKQQQRSTP
jgi:hypothetical protein